MTWHPDRTAHAYFCPKCKEEFERSEPGKCDVCGLTLVPSGYCVRCGGYWRLRVGQLCPDHGTVLEAESAQEARDMDGEARAVDPGLDPEIVYKGDAVSCAMAQAALNDAGIEAQVDDSKTDVAAVSYLPFTEGVGRVVVARRDVERALEIVRDFEERPSTRQTEA